MEISGKEVKSKEQNHSVKGNPSQRALPLGPAPSLSRETLTTESWGGGAALYTHSAHALSRTLRFANHSGFSGAKSDSS